MGRKRLTTLLNAANDELTCLHTIDVTLAYVLHRIEAESLAQIDVGAANKVREDSAGVIPVENDHLGIRVPCEGSQAVVHESCFAPTGGHHQQGMPNLLDEGVEVNFGAELRSEGCQ